MATFGDILSNLTIGACQSIRRNAGDSAFEAYTPTGATNVEWTGTTSNGIGTYVDANTICSEPNLTFDGSTLSVSGDTYSTGCVCSPLITGTTLCSSDIWLMHGVGTNPSYIYADATDYVRIRAGTGWTYFDTASINNNIRLYDNSQGSTYYSQLTGDEFRLIDNGSFRVQMGTTFLNLSIHEDSHDAYAVNLYHDRLGGSSEDGDEFVKIRGYFKNDAGTPETVAGFQITGTVTDVSDGTEDSKFSFYNIIDGVWTEHWFMNTALSVTTSLNVDTINEYTPSSGVTIEGVLLRDNWWYTNFDTADRSIQIQLGNSSATVLPDNSPYIRITSNNQYDPFVWWRNSSSAIDWALHLDTDDSDTMKFTRDNATILGIDSTGLLVNNIDEYTGTVGVTIDSVCIKDSGLTAHNQICSTVSTGTAPFTIASTTLNTNLNADLLDGFHASALSGGTLSWTGSTANGVGTYADANTVCSEPNLTFDGTDLTVATGGKIYADVLQRTGSNNTCIEFTDQEEEVIQIYVNHATQRVMEIWDAAVIVESVAQFQAQGTSYFAGASCFTGLGTAETETHLVAINDATGALNKRSVASITSGITGSSYWTSGATALCPTNLSQNFDVNLAAGHTIRLRSNNGAADFSLGTEGNYWCSDGGEIFITTPNDFKIASTSVGQLYMGDDGTPNNTLTDCRAIAARVGFEYADNYSSGYTARSLVDAGYVTGITSGASWVSGTSYYICPANVNDSIMLGNGTHLYWNSTNVGLCGAEGATDSIKFKLEGGWIWEICGSQFKRVVAGGPALQNCTAALDCPTLLPDAETYAGIGGLNGAVSIVNAGNSIALVADTSSQICLPNINSGSTNADSVLGYCSSTGQVVYSLSPFAPYEVLTSGATVTWNARTGLNKTLEISDDFTLSLTNLLNGMSGDLRMCVPYNTVGITLPASKLNGSVSGLTSGVYHLAWIYDGTNLDFNIALYE